MSLLDPDSIIQYSTGVIDTTGAPGTGVNVTFSLGSTALAGNSVYFLYAYRAGVGTIYVDQGVWYNQASGTGATSGDLDQTSVVVWSTYLTADASSWTYLSDADVVAPWMAVEVTGFEPSWQGTPWASRGNPKEVYPGPAFNYDNTGTATSIDTGVGSTTLQGSMMWLASFSTLELAGGTPKTVSSYANSAPQEGTWATLGAHVASARGAAYNIGLDVAYKIAHVDDAFGAVATYPSAPHRMNAIMGGAIADWLPAQKTASRPAVPGSVS